VQDIRRALVPEVDPLLPHVSEAGSLRVWGTKGECSEWLWQGIGVTVILGKEVPAAEPLRVSGPTSGTSNRLVI